MKRVLPSDPILDKLMMFEEKPKHKSCPVCEGRGSYYQEGDLHRSGGFVPCYAFDKTHHCRNGQWIRKDGRAV